MTDPTPSVSGSKDFVSATEATRISRTVQQLRNDGEDDAADLIELLASQRRQHRAKHKSYKRRFREAESALADARRDAERYRFLRESGNTGRNGSTIQRGITVANASGVILHFVYWTDQDGFDAAIDAAIGATHEG